MGIEDQLLADGISKGSKWDINAKGRYFPTYNNAMLFLEASSFKIRWNDFAGIIEINGKKYQDNDSIIIKEAMRKQRLEVSLKTIDEAVISIGLKNQYHPVKDYINNLTWDGLPRTKTWLHDLCGAEDTPYNSFIGRLILVSSIKRIFEPGCKYDTMIILEGEQGIGKSRLCHVLGGDWYKAVGLSDRDHNTVQLMQGGWFIEVPELAVFAKRDIESLKAFISNPVDMVRFAFGRTDGVYPRQSVFIGTINPEANGYLMDSTGNRRFMPVTLKTINIDKIKELRDQLFAEAMYLYREGFEVFIKTEEMNNFARAQQAQREYHDDWSTLISNYININRLDTGMKMTCLDVYTKILQGKAEQYDQRTGRRIANILRKLGCPEPIHTRVNDIQGKYFDMSILIKSTLGNEKDHDVGWKDGNE